MGKLVDLLGYLIIGVFLLDIIFLNLDKLLGLDLTNIFVLFFFLYIGFSFIAWLFLDLDYIIKFILLTVGIYRVIYTLIIDKQIKLVFNDKRV